MLLRRDYVNFYQGHLGEQQEAPQQEAPQQEGPQQEGLLLEVGVRVARIARVAEDVRAEGGAEPKVVRQQS